MVSGVLQALRGFLGARTEGDVIDQQLLAAIMAEEEASEPLAYCYLFVDLCHVDGSFDQRERGAVISLLAELFHTPHPEALRMIKLAEAQINSFRGPKRFVATIKKDFSPQERTRILQALDRIMSADSIVSNEELQFKNRVMGLLDHGAPKNQHRLDQR